MQKKDGYLEEKSNKCLHKELALEKMRATI